MIKYTGFERNIGKVLGKDSYDMLFSSINLTKLQEDIYLSCIGGWVPIWKVLKALALSKEWVSGLDEKFRA